MNIYGSAIPGATYMASIAVRVDALKAGTD